MFPPVRCPCRQDEGKQKSLHRIAMKVLRFLANPALPSVLTNLPLLSQSLLPFRDLLNYTSIIHRALQNFRRLFDLSNQEANYRIWCGDILIGSHSFCGALCAA